MAAALQPGRCAQLPAASTTYGPNHNVHAACMSRPACYCASCSCGYVLAHAAHNWRHAFWLPHHVRPTCCEQVLCDVALFDGDLMRWTPPLPTPHFLCAHSSVAMPLPALPALPASALGDRFNPLHTFSRNCRVWCLLA